MPAETDLPRYEAFVVQPDKSTHWVVAIVSERTRTKARRFARLHNATATTRLADALNSRLLDRPNHQARLRAALDGLPLTVHAAVRHVPTRDQAEDVLADHLSGDPIDGLLLFSDSPTTITSRTAYTLAFAAEDISDLCQEATNPQTARRFLPRLPTLVRRQRPEQLLNVSADLDQLADDLRGIGKALIRQQVVAADEVGLWTLQTAIFTENRASIALHHAAGYRTVGIRERIAQLNDTWHDTVLIERRADSVDHPSC